MAQLDVCCAAPSGTTITMDAVAEWTDAQRRVIDLVTSLSEADAKLRVPACPAWTVRDLLAHVIGLDADVLAGDEPEDHNPDWTQRQVDRRADDTVDMLVTEWRSLTEGMQSWIRSNDPRPLGDVVIHEQDLRGAVSVPGGRDSAGLAAIRDRMADAFTDRIDQIGNCAVSLIGESWELRAGDPNAAPLTLQAPTFDLARALMSRRSAEQLRRWTVAGNIEPFLPVFASLGPLPDGDLVE